MYNWGVDVLSVYGKHLKPPENRLAMLQMSTWRNAAFCSVSVTFTSLSLPQRSIPQYQMAMQDPMVYEGQVSLAQSDLTGVSSKRTQPLTTSFIWCCQFKHPPVHDKTQTNAAPIISPTVVPPIINGVPSAHRSASSRLLKSFTSSRKSSGPSRYHMQPWGTPYLKDSPLHEKPHEIYLSQTSESIKQRRPLQSLLASPGEFHGWQEDYVKRRTQVQQGEAKRSFYFKKLQRFSP